MAEAKTEEFARETGEVLQELGIQRVEAEYFGENDDGQIEDIVCYDLAGDVIPPVSSPHWDSLEDHLWDLLMELRPSFYDGAPGACGTLTVLRDGNNVRVILNHQVREWVDAPGEDFTVPVPHHGRS